MGHSPFALCLLRSLHLPLLDLELAGFLLSSCVGILLLAELLAAVSLNLVRRHHLLLARLRGGPEAEEFGRIRHLVDLVGRARHRRLRLGVGCAQELLLAQGLGRAEQAWLAVLNSRHVAQEHVLGHPWCRLARSPIAQNLIGASVLGILGDVLLSLLRNQLSESL